MDHTEAVRLQAAEKYLLGEFTHAQRDEYEEHYFDCVACAEELKATAAFMESAKQVARERVPQTVDNKKLSKERGGWFAWLRPAFAVPVFAALLLVVAYENAITIPHLKQDSARAVTAEAFRSFFLSAGTRGEGASSLTIKIRPDELFALDVDMPGNSPDGYVCQISDQSGRVRLSVPVSPDEAKNTVHLKIPGGALNAGNYNFTILKGQNPAAAAGSVGSTPPISFTVEFVQ